MIYSTAHVQLVVFTTLLNWFVFLETIYCKRALMNPCIGRRILCIYQKSDQGDDSCKLNRINIAILKPQSNVSNCCPQVIISLHVLFWIFDRLPFLYLAFSIFCHCIYSLNLKNFPFISLTSIPFLSSCGKQDTHKMALCFYPRLNSSCLVLVFVDHFLWFNYFTSHYKPFMDIAAFFGLCVWLVPFAYFISLSANDNALPTSGKSSNVDQREG